jgi:hypothetical protein
MAGCANLIGGIAVLTQFPRLSGQSGTMPDLRVWLQLTVGGDLVS